MSRSKTSPCPPIWSVLSPSRPRPSGKSGRSSSTRRASSPPRRISPRRRRCSRAYLARSTCVPCSQLTIFPLTARTRSSSWFPPRCSGPSTASRSLWRARRARNKPLSHHGGPRTEDYRALRDTQPADSAAELVPAHVRRRYRLRRRLLRRLGYHRDDSARDIRSLVRADIVDSRFLRGRQLALALTRGRVGTRAGLGGRGRG